MLRLAADENFSGRIVRGIRRQLPGVDLIRVQDSSFAGAADPDILRWAAEVDRILLTHDVSTMTAFAMQRVGRGERMPGLVEVRLELPVGRAIDDLVLLATASEPGEWEGQILYLPL